MGCRTARRTPAESVNARARILMSFAAAALCFGSSRYARADRHDLQLMNLCQRSADGSCPWVRPSATGTSVDLSTDPEATTRFRSLMSELGVVIAPRLQTPADTLGFAGFQFSAELGMTQISHDQTFWDGVQGVTPSNRLRSRPDAWLTTVGGFVRKGMWFPIPALEWGAGAVNILQSGMWAVQGYVKLALQEGFHDWPLPSVAVRGGVSQLVGTDQVALTVSSVDVVLSKAFSLAGTARIQPFVGWDFLFIDARSGVIDATPGCDAVVQQQTDRTNAQAVAMLPKACMVPAQQIVPADAWAGFDANANFTFPRQDIITRHQFYGGVKVKLAMLFVVGQVAVALAGHSHDGRVATNAGRDTSATQRAASISGGFDF